MTLAEVQTEVAHWSDNEVNALAAFLTMLCLKRSDEDSSELSRRLDDKRSETIGLTIPLEK